MIVRESISFERGKGTKKTLKIGVASILTYPFDYELIPPNFYYVYSSSPGMSAFVCIGQKTKEGSFFMRSKWALLKDGVMSNYLRYDNHTSIISFSDQPELFYQWANDNGIKKLEIISDQEFNEIANKYGL